MRDLDYANEWWADIPSEPSYQASTHGRIRNKDTYHILSQHINPDGYPTVCLHHHTVKSVHRLVAEAFYGMHDDMQVNHIDCDRTNNWVLNLEWCTRSENIKWSVYKGTNAHDIASKRAAEVNRKRVRIVETGDEFDSLQSCANYLGVTRGNVSRCLSGERKGQRIHGYRIEYV